MFRSIQHKAFGRKKGATLLAFCAAVMLLAACSSGHSSTPARQQNGPGVEAANRLVQQYETAPASIGVTEPVGVSIPKGKKVVFIQCPVSSCQVIADRMKEAARTLGWQFSTIKTSGQPANLKAAFDQALRGKPDGVAYTGFARSSFDQEIKDIAAYGGKVVACCVEDPLTKGLTYNIRGGETADLEGRILAAYAAVHSKAGDEAAMVGFPVYPVLVKTVDGWKKGMHEFSPSTRTKTFDVALSNVGVDIPQKVVNFLRANPKVTTLTFATDDLILGVPQALKAAGLSSKVLILGKDAGPTNLQYIKSGQQAVSIPSPNNELGYFLIDALARQFAGKSPAPAMVQDPLVLWDQKNVPDSVNTPTVANYKQQFEKLWGITAR